ncbi:RDD family protein [Sphaerisporangium viridialbum]|uniref:RDD family protein n=1 Tax=Sphaerisporangium viridialbum TaxID=46189 RepID=UPI003C77594A
MTLSPGGPEVRALAARRYRFLASLIDLILLSIVNFVISTALVPGFFSEPAADVQMPEQTILDQYFGNPYVGDPYWPLQLTFAIILFAYYWISHARWGRTLGKRLCRLKVVARDGGPLTVSQAGLRAFIFAAASSIPYIGLVLSLLDSLWILGDAKRCLHDVLARTVVVGVGSAVRPREQPA